ncbi:hypothetical protein M5J14_08250 [Lysinibacillus sp. OL1_EC]|uniref:hypothetical protein n=1 Tax=unclassified Lysinibacillus TaxID=2636778 RepID=UPI00103BFD76|nr:MULTISPECIES: hypothetical protein [unclassified Lysinibacillus]MCM0624517.1 hypothetical protein [Lysinibacillus sp. OL1_EC]TBV88215.1 hypothetical protein EW028_07185 [Lysinibacillus sp. OL1]
MNINNIFPKTKNIIETYVYYDKPLYFLYKFNDALYFVFFYIEENDFEKWVCIPTLSEEIEELKETRKSLINFIKDSSKIILLTIDFNQNNRVINLENILYSQLEEEFLPNRDAYLKGNSLFNVKFETDIAKVEQLVINHLAGSEFEHFMKYNELVIGQSRIVADGVLVDEKDNKIFIEVKYFRFSKNVEYRRISNHIVNLHNTYQLDRNPQNKLLYIIVIKNEDKENIKTVQQILSLNSAYLKSNALNSEVRVYSVYDLIEGKSEYLNLY